MLRGGGGQCDELVFTVEAETDVGSTGPSTNTTGGFRKTIENIITKCTILVALLVVLLCGCNSLHV